MSKKGKMKQYQGLIVPEQHKMKMEHANGRGRSASTARRSSGFVARMRSRSRQPKQRPSLEEPEPPEVSEKPAAAQIVDAIDRHQLALKMDVMELVENREKEIAFWKNKALKMKRRISQEGGQDSTSHAVSSDGERTESDPRQAEKVSFLEKELQSRDVLIETLRTSLVMHEKAREESVARLETQLECLVEMNTKVASTNGEQFLSQMNKEDVLDNHTPRDPAHETSVLEQLLARVLAEKDRLMHENQNLKKVLKAATEISPRNSTEERPLPPRNNTNAGEKSAAVLSQRRRASGDTNEGSHLQSSFLSSVASGLGLGKGADEQHETYAVRYQLSCKNCVKNHNHMKYAGACTGNPADAQHLLKSRLNDHFSTIWRVVQEEEGSISSSVRPHEWSRDEANPDEFASSSLARHIAKHCTKSANEADVAKWCRENVKVEIKPGGEGGNAHTSSEKKKKKHKKREKARLPRTQSESSF